MTEIVEIFLPSDKLANEDLDMDNDNQFTPTMVFGAVVLLAFVWIAIFMVLPAITGKPGVAQKMQQDLQKSSENEAVKK